MEWRTVVGVSGDIRFRDLRDASPTIFIPWQQSDAWQGEFAIRTALPLPAMLPVLRRELQAVDPRLALWSAKSMDELLGGPLAQPRLSAFLMSGFGMVALLLASIGLYGLMAAVVRSRPARSAFARPWVPLAPGCGAMCCWRPCGSPLSGRRSAWPGRWPGRGCSAACSSR